MPIRKKYYFSIFCRLKCKGIFIPGTCFCGRQRSMTHVPTVATAYADMYRSSLVNTTIRTHPCSLHLAFSSVFVRTRRRVGGWGRIVSDFFPRRRKGGGGLAAVVLPPVARRLPPFCTGERRNSPSVGIGRFTWYHSPTKKLPAYFPLSGGRIRKYVPIKSFFLLPK